MTDFWDTAVCSLIEVDQRFRGAYCVNHQGDALKQTSDSEVCTASIINAMKLAWL
jgi:hypothetical protein